MTNDIIIHNIKITVQRYFFRNHVDKESLVYLLPNALRDMVSEYVHNGYTLSDIERAMSEHGATKRKQFYHFELVNGKTKIL